MCVIVAVLLPMLVLMLMLMLVVVAASGRRIQLAIEESGNKGLDCNVRRSRSHCDAVLRETGQRAMPNTTRNDHLNASLTQPSWE
jgi:hypothetical protein